MLMLMKCNAIKEAKHLGCYNPGMGFVDHSAVGTIYSTKTGVVAETDYSTNSRTTVDLNYDSTD
jgi:hypothetical protein